MLAVFVVRNCLMEYWDFVHTVLHIPVLYWNYAWNANTTSFLRTGLVRPCLSRVQVTLWRCFDSHSNHTDSWEISSRLGASIHAVVGCVPWWAATSSGSNRKVIIKCWTSSQCHEVTKGAAGKTVHPLFDFAVERAASFMEAVQTIRNGNSLRCRLWCCAAGQWIGKWIAGCTRHAPTGKSTMSFLIHRCPRTTEEMYGERTSFSLLTGCNLYIRLKCNIYRLAVIERYKWGTGKNVPNRTA